MVRETRYLLVGNLPENVTEDEISEYFKRFSKIQSVKIHGKKENEDYVCATVAFADIKSASKANSTDNSINGKVLTTSYSEGSATGSVVKRTLDEPRPSFSAIRPSSYTQRKGPEDGEVYEGRDYYSRAGPDPGQYSGYTEEYQRGRPRDRFQGRGGFKQFERGVHHHQWAGGRRHFGEAHRSNSSSDRDAFEKPRVPQSPARSSSQASRKSPKMKRKQSNSTSRSRSGSSDSSSSSSYSDSSSDSSRSRSRSGSRSSNRASRSKLPGSQVKSARSRSQGSNASGNTETTEGGNCPHGIKITNLPSRSSDTSLRDGLFHEFKKYGKVNAVQISGNGDGRHAIVSFKKGEDARKARIASQDKRFFGTNIRVAEHIGIDVDDAEFRPPEAELDEHHPKATRTLFVGNLEKEITMEELKVMFSKYGEILDIDVKRQGAISAYSFIQFTDIKSVVKALRALDGETMGGMKLKLGFGKSMPTNCVWVDNLADTVQENFLFRQFARYGPLSNMVIDRERGKALISFNSLENAQFALNEMRNRILNGQKIQIDFASRDCQTDFYEKMEKSGQLKPGQRSNWNYQRQQSGGEGQGQGQWVERGRGKFPFVRGGRGFVRGGRGQRWMSGRGGYSKDYPDDYRRQRSYDEYSQGGGTPYSEGDFESDLHAYRTQRERQRSCSPDQYSDDMYGESYRDYKSRYAEYGAGSPGSEPDEAYEYKSRDEMFYKEQFGSREGSPKGSYRGRSWSHSPTRNKVKDPERNTPPTPLGGDDTQDFSSNEQSPSDLDGKLSDNKRSGKNDFDITEADIQELRTSKYSSAHRKESLSRSEERYSRKRSYEDTFSRDTLSKDETILRKVDRQLSHGSHEKLSISDSKRDLYQKMKKIQSEISGKMLARTPMKEGEGQASSNSSDSDRGDMTVGDLSKLQHEKQLLIEKLKQLEDANNSDNEHLDVDSGKKSSSKRPRLDPWSGKRLQSELGNVILGPKKDKSYDVSQSYRKQMEAMRKMEEITVKEENVKTTSKKNDMFSYEDEKEDMPIPQGLLSPKDVPSSFVKKRKKTDLLEESKNRMYRHKRENEDERMSSDNDETAKNVIRTDSITSVGSVRRLSSGHSSPRTPLPGHLSLENVEHRLSESEQLSDLASSLFIKKTDTSKRRSKDEHSSPVIIPLGEDILVTDIPDPRVPKLKSEEEYCLPLPKFAEFTPPMKCTSSNSENSGDLSKENSPCFSPPSSGSKNESPQMSPNDTTSEESQTLSNPEPTYIPEENSNEPTIEGSENQDMDVDKPPVEIEEALSDSSDHNDDFSLDERIRKLDEKLNQLPITTQSSKMGAENMSSSSIGINISSSNPPAKSYSKFKIKKRQDSVGVSAEETEKGDKSSEIVKTIINRSSIFDLDSKRLEQINEKYSPHSKSVVSNAEDSSNNVTLRTKAEAKEMPLATLPGSLAGRLGNGGSSFPTLSVNTQPTVPLGVKTDDKQVTSLSPSSGKTYLQDQTSQEGQTADMCSYNKDNRIINLNDRLELQNDLSSSFSTRFNSIDNGVNKTNITSTRTLVESVIESTEKIDSISPSDSKFNSDPRLRKDLLCKNIDEHLDLNNKKIDTTQDNKTKKSPPKSLDSSKLEMKLDSGVKSDSVCEIILESKSLTNESNHEESNTDLTSVYLGKRKCEINSKKDKLKTSDNNSASTNCDSSGHKSDIKSGSESPEPKKVKLSSPEKDKSETNSPNHDSAKSDKHKKDSDKKSKESKKKEKTEGDSVNKDKGFNDKKDKDHDGDKNKSENSEQSESKSDKTLKPLPETVKKEMSNKLEGKDGDKSQTKKESDKRSEHSTSKKEKKSDGSSSKKSSGSKSDSLHKKENKSSTESKSKDKTKSSHKAKDLSKGKDDKTDKDGQAKSHSMKISKSGSTEKVDSSKESQNNQQKESVSTSEGDKKDVKTVDNKEVEKLSEFEKSEKSTDTSQVEKPSELPKEKSKISEKPKDKSSAENKHKTKSDSSKTKSKNVDSSKHKSKSEDQHKSKSSHDVTKKSADKMKQKDLSKVKTKSDIAENPKEKATDSKSQTLDKPVDSENKTKSESKSTESESGKTADKVDKTKSLDDTKSKEKTSLNENGKPKDKTGNGATMKAKEKSDHDKSKSTESGKPKDKAKHSESAHNKSKSKEEKPKQPPTTSHIDKQKDKSHKDNSKKDDDRSKSDSKKEGGSESKSSSTSKPASDNNTAPEKKEENNQDNKSENKSEKSENKNDGKTDNSSENADSMAKHKPDCNKERKKSGESKSSKSSSKKSSSEKKSETKSGDKKNSKKGAKKEEKSSPKDKNKQQEVEFDWSAWVEEPYVSMYDRVKRKSSEKDKEREMQEMKSKFNHFAKSRKKHSKLSETEESDFSHDSDEETDAFEEEKVAKPSKEVSSVHDNGTKRKRCVIDTSTSSDDDDSQLFKSFQKSTLGKEKSKGAPGKLNKHSVNDIYSSDSSETDIDFPPISPAKKKTKKTKKAKKPQIHHDSDSEYDKTPDKQKKKKNMSNKPKPKSTPKKKSEIKTPPNHHDHSNHDTHESDLYDIDSDMDIFDRIKLKNQKKSAQKVPTKSSAKKLLDTTTDDSDNPMLSPSRIANMKKPDLKPVKKSILSDPTLFDTDSDSSFPDLSTVTSKNCLTKKVNHEINKNEINKNEINKTKKPSVTVGTGVIAQTIRNEDIGQKNAQTIRNEDTGQKNAQTIRNEDIGQKNAQTIRNEDIGQKNAQTIRNKDIGQKNDLEIKKKEKIKKKSKKNDIMKADDAKKCGENGKGLFEKIENFIYHSDSKEKDSKEKVSVKHSRKEGKSQNHKHDKNMGYLDEEEISQAEKLVNNMNKLEKPTKHESTKSNKIVKLDQEKTKRKTKKIEHSLSSETDTDKEAKSHSSLYHENKSVGDGKKDKDLKKADEAKLKTKKKKHDNTSVESTQKPLVEVARKVDDVDLSKKSSNKIEMEDVLKKQTNKKEIDDGCMKKVTSKLEMDNGPFKKQTNKIERDDGYKIGFGFFENFPLLENEKNYGDNGLKRGKKKKEKNEDEEKITKKDIKEGVIKSDEKTPKKKERKKKDALSEMNVKENGPKLEELVGRLAKSAQNDVFDFQEEEDDKPLFAEFFKVKEEMAKKAAANKQDKPDGKNSLENKLSSIEKSDDASSESHEETETGLKNDLKKLQKLETTKIEELNKTDSKQESEKIEETIKSSLFSPTSDDGKIEEQSISDIFSPKHVKEACKDEAKHILAFASPKGIEMGKSDDESSKSSLISPVKVGVSPKGKGKQEIVVCQVEMELKEDRLKKITDNSLKEISLAGKKWGGMMALKDDTSKKEKCNILSEGQKTKSALDADKNDHQLTHGKQSKKGKVKVSDKPEMPEKSREEIMLEAVSSLEKLSENTSVVTPEPDNYTEDKLVIDETTAAVETVTEEPELTEQAQNETDLAILSILPFDEKNSTFVEPLQHQPPLVESQPVVAPENVVIETEQITLESNARDTSLEQNDLVIDTAAPQTNEKTAAPQTNENQKDVLHEHQKGVDLPENHKDVHLPVPATAALSVSTKEMVPATAALSVPTKEMVPASAALSVPTKEMVPATAALSVPTKEMVPATAALSVPTKEMVPAMLAPSSHVVDPISVPAGETPAVSTVVPVEKSVQQKEKQPKPRRHQKPKENVKVQNELKDADVTSGQVLKTAQPPVIPTEQTPVIPNMQAHMFGLMQDPKYGGLPKQVPEIQKPEPYRKTRKQKANAKANHQVEVPGTFYPPVYNAIDHGFHLQNNLQGGDASEKENEEKLSQPYDQDKHDDGDNLRISGDEGSNSTDKRSRRGRKAQNYKELNSGVLGRTTSPRSRTSPRSPRAGMSPRQALSPLSSPKSELSSPVVKIERLPFGCNKNIRMDSDVSNDAMTEGKQQISEVVENHNDHQGFASTKKMVEEISKAAPVTNPVKDATNVFDFDDNEPELKIDTTPLKATRTKKGRRSTQDSKITNTEVKNTIGSPNHIVSPLESRWQCKKDSESDKGGNHPLKLTIALAHSTMVSTSATNSMTSVINTATIIDSTIPSIKGKKDLESIPKVSSAAITMVSSAVTAAVTTMTAPTLPKTLCKSNVDRIIDDVSKGIFDWAATTGMPAELNKDHLLTNITGISSKVMESQTVAPQPTKKRHAGARGHTGEQDMMPPPIVSLPGQDLIQTKSSSVLTPSVVSSPFGTSAMTASHGRPPLQTTPASVASTLVSSQGQIGEPPVVSYSQTKSTPQITKTKPLDMALNMTSRPELMTPAHSLSTAAVVTTTTTTTVAQQNPGTSVVMSSQRPTVSNSGNTTVLAGRTVTVKPPNTEAYLQQMGLHPGSIPSQAPISAHQPTMPRISEGKQGFPHGFMPSQTFSRPEVHMEHSKPVSTVASSEKQPQVTSSAPTCVVHPITSVSGKTAGDAKLLHQQMKQSVSRAQTIPTSSQPIPPAHMQHTQAQFMEKDQQPRTIGMHGQPPMMHLMGQPPLLMPNHIQHKSEKSGKTKLQKAEMPQPNEPMQRPPSAHSQKSINEPQRPLSAHENQALFQEQIRNLVGKGFIPPGVAIPPQILQMYHHQQQQLAAAAKIEDKKGHKGHPPKEMISPGIAHQPSSMFAASIASQSSNPQIKSPAVAQTAPSPHPVFSQPSTSQARPSSPGVKKMNDKFNQNHWPNESLVDARNEAQRSRPTSVEPAPSPKHWAYSGNQQPKPAHQQNMDSNSKAHLEAVRLVEQHKHQEMLRLQHEKQDRAKLQEIQRQEIQRREELIRQQQAMKSRDNVPPTSAGTSQQSDRDRQTASVPGKPRSSHMPNNTESGPSVIDPRSLHHLSELRGPRGQSQFAAPSGEMIQGIPAHVYRDPEFQQRLHAAAALRMPHLLDPHLIPQGYPLGLPHPYLAQVGSLPMDHPHIPDSRPPSQGGSHGIRSPPPRQAHQAVMKSPNIPVQSRQMPDPPPGEGSLLSLLQRYPVMWQGTLALKNDSCAVQMHVISGFNALVQTALPQQIVEGTCQPLRIAQRMRLEAAQLEGVVKRMQYDNDYCMLLALPCGSDHDDIIYQTRAMSTGFIQYLQQKQAAGIVNVADPGSQQPAYVVHIFPPCEFSHETLGRLGFELLHQVRNLSHLLVIITTVA